MTLALKACPRCGGAVRSYYTECECLTCGWAGHTRPAPRIRYANDPRLMSFERSAAKDKSDRQRYIEYRRRWRQRRKEAS